MVVIKIAVVLLEILWLGLLGMTRKCILLYCLLRPKMYKNVTKHHLTIAQSLWPNRSCDRAEKNVKSQGSNQAAGIAAWNEVDAWKSMWLGVQEKRFCLVGQLGMKMTLLFWTGTKFRKRRYLETTEKQLEKPLLICLRSVLSTQTSDADWFYTIRRTYRLLIMLWGKGLCLAVTKIIFYFCDVSIPENIKCSRELFSCELRFS